MFVPAGRWAFQGSIIMTHATSLVGTYVTVPSHGLEGPPVDGSVLMPLGGRGVESGGESAQRDAGRTSPSHLSHWQHSST